MRGKPEIVQSGTETEPVFYADKHLATEEDAKKLVDQKLQTDPKESAEIAIGFEPMVHQQTATDVKEFKTQTTELDLDFELEAIRGKLPKDVKEPEESPTLQRKPSEKSPRKLPTFEDKGWKGENEGRPADVSDFDPKKKLEKKDTKVGKLDADDYAFLKKDKDKPPPKRKAGKKVIRDSPFKKQNTTEEKSSPVSKSSGFKRQLTTGTRNS